MVIVVVCAAVTAVAGLWLTMSRDADGMTPWQRFLLVRSLADLTAIHEAVERAGGHPDLLTRRQLAVADRVLVVGEHRMRAAGPSVVTRELLRNMRLAMAVGQSERVMVQNDLLNRLVRGGLAADPETVA